MKLSNRTAPAALSEQISDRAVKPGDIVGYRILDKIHESDKTIAYRAIRERDGLPVVLKVLQEARAADGALRYKHEHAILSRLTLEGVARCHGIEKLNNTWMLVLEDFAGQSLKRWMESEHFSLHAVLTIGIHLCEALGEIHAAHIIHKDINPSNIILNLETGQLKFIDFGHATALSREQPSITSPSTLEGTLHYISPEQTGRMNRAVDYRADFYSLGATLYELLTQRRPFATNNELELVHYHIARPPIPPCEIDSDIPRAVSDIVIKLLAKTAEQRYQSAQGIKADLEECVEQLNRRGRIDPFTLGQRDASDRFQIPQKLYGREKEVGQLLDLFSKVSNGAREIALIAGHPGIGKSALVRELHRPITERQGYFISGKFDQLQRNIPYQGVISVFRELVRQLLTESEERLGEWRNKLHEAFGANGQIIVDVIPDVALIIGAQPPVQTLDRIQTQNRFNRLFRNFIRLFCQAEHPLVVYLDDLQWADPESLQLIVNILRDADMQYLLLIGTYRDNEVRDGHPLLHSLDELRKDGVIPSHISLGPLGLAHVGQMIAEALHTTQEYVEPLAELVIHKTGGNPFFTEEFLKSLYTENLLRFDREKGVWQWNLEQIQARGITDNVVDLMTAKLQRLPAATRDILQLAACIGAQFELHVLAIAAQKPLKETAELLAQAAKDGMVIPIGGQYRYVHVYDSPQAANVEYRFAHDRIQQAAYGLIPKDTERAAHYRIGRLLLANTPREALEENVFAIVNHLNYGVDLIATEEEKEQLAAHNLLAGKKAKASTAYDAALKYFSIGMEILGKDNWQRHYSHLLSFHTEAAETAYLKGRFDEMDRLVEIGLAQATDLLDKIRFYEIKILGEIAQSRLRPMLKTALTVLRLVGVNLPHTPRWWHFAATALRTRFLAAKIVRTDLSTLPAMTDERALAAMRILPSVVSGAYWSQPALIPLVVTAMVRLSIKYGNAPTSPFGYVSYGMYLCGMRRDYDTGFRFGQIALRTLDRVDAKEHRAKTVGLFNSMIRHHKEHVQLVLPALMDAYQAGVESGDLEHAGNTALVYCVNSLNAGKELPSLYEELCKYAAAISTLGQKGPLHVTQIYRQFVLNLMGKSKDPCVLVGEDYDGEAMIPGFLEANERTTLHSIYLAKTTLNLLFGNYAQALKGTDARAQYVGSVASTFSQSMSEFYDSLARLANYEALPQAERRRMLRRVGQTQELLRVRAQHAPMNHLQKFLLVEAERERVQGHTLAAMGLYDRAIAAAQENGFIQEQALASELAAKFYLQQKKDRFAALYMRDARRLYKQWGASAKVADLEARYAALLGAPEGERTSAGSTGGSMTQSHIDLKTLTQALKVISEEKIHSRLLEKTIRSAIEFAGAQKGLLLLLRKDKDDLYIEAEGSIENDDIAILRSTPIEQSDRLSKTVINYVRRTKESVVVHSATEPNTLLSRLHSEEYIKKNQTRSILCIPIKIGSGTEAELIGLLYLENNSASNAFTEQRIETLEIICLAAAGRLELSREAVTDSLTGLYNHNYFQNVLRKELSLARRKQRPLSLVMADIDHFKNFNDTWGHQLGDRVLQSVANALKLSCRQTDVVARYGGEEIAIILPETDAAMALEVAERMRSYVEQSSLDHEGRALKVTVSIGVATLQPDTESAAELIKAADGSLYRSKAEGRNKVTLAS